MMDRPASKPHLGGGDTLITDKYDLVERTQYLYVRVVKAKDLPARDVVNGSCDPYVEVRMGNYKGMTSHHSEMNTNPEWDRVLAFSRDQIQASALEVTVKDHKDVMKDDFLGWVLFDLNEVPKRVPPDSPLAPQWYRLEDRKGDRSKGELMLAVWWGTQADEAFPKALHSSAAASVGGADGLADICSKVYLSPKLWYLRVRVIEVQELLALSDTIIKVPNVFVNAIYGHQALTTRVSTSRSPNFSRDKDDLMFVVAEPFQEHLMVTVENSTAVLGKCAVHLLSVERRLDDKAISSRWFNLEKDVTVVGEKKEVMFASKIHMMLCLEGGYHVMDESFSYSSDFRPTEKKLWKKSIGVLELGILGASGLLPMRTKYGRETTDAYCVAKYGEKWVRTRTIIDSWNPKWNEEYSWEVYDPCTVITIGVFDNCHLQGEEETKDMQMGKVIRIRLSTLETNCVYTHAYPLLALHPSGVKKMGKIDLAVRFSCSSFLNMMHGYSQPLLPKMHQIRPLTAIQLDRLRQQAIQIVSMRLSQAEPPLRKEVVEYMLDVGSHMWSMRRSKANIFRVMGVMSGLFAFFKWFDQIRSWRNPVTTTVIHVIFVVVVLYPQFILTTVFLSLFLLGVWNFRFRPRRPPHIDSRLSYADAAHPDELDEEFDTFPTSRPADIISMRYDRLRSVCGRIQTVAGDFATQGERLQSLVSWRDPRATALFLIFCLVAAIVVYAKPLYVVVIQTGFILLNHPRFQHNLPSVPVNFFRRLPSRSDCML